MIRYHIDEPTAEAMAAAVALATRPKSMIATFMASLGVGVMIGSVRMRYVRTVR